jgi:hypothetical protein
MRCSRSLIFELLSKRVYLRSDFAEVGGGTNSDSMRTARSVVVSFIPRKRYRRRAVSGCGGDFGFIDLLFFISVRGFASFRSKPKVPHSSYVERHVASELSVAILHIDRLVKKQGKIEPLALF